MSMIYSFLLYDSAKKVNHESVTERKEINMEKLLNLSEEYMRAVFFLQLFCRFFKIEFLTNLQRARGIQSWIRQGTLPSKTKGGQKSTQTTAIRSSSRKHWKGTGKALR